MTERDTSVKVAVRVRPLNFEEQSQDSSVYINALTQQSQVNLPNTYLMFQIYAY